MQRHLLGEEQLSTTKATSPRRWQKSLAHAASVADVVCLRALQCRRRTAGRDARLRSLAAPGRPPAALARGRSGRGARALRRSKARRGPRPVIAPAVPALQRRVGVADASAEERPGAALARDRRRAEERSSRAPEARAAVRSREPCPGPSATARRAHRTTTAVSVQLVGRQGVAGASVSEWRRYPGGAWGLRVAKRSASLTAGAVPNRGFGPRGAASARAGGRSEEGPPARAVLAPGPSSPRATKPPGAPFRAFPRRPPV